LHFADTEEDGGSTPPAPTAPAVTRAFVLWLVPLVNGDCAARRTQRRESTYLLNRRRSLRREASGTRRRHWRADVVTGRPAQPHLSEGDTTEVVHRLDGPVPAQQVGEAGGAGLGEAEAGDHADGHGLPPPTPAAGVRDPTMRLRVTCRIWAACGNSTRWIATTMRVRCSMRPCAWSRVRSKTGTWCYGRRWSGPAGWAGWLDRPSQHLTFAVSSGFGRTCGLRRLFTRRRRASPGGVAWRNSLRERKRSISS
jgi:hypothetical protein